MLSVSLILFNTSNIIAFVLRLNQKTVIWSETEMSPVEILELIEIFREKLNTFALDKPLVDPEVVQLSQRLDSLLNIYSNM